MKKQLYSEIFVLIPAKYSCVLEFSDYIVGWHMDKYSNSYRFLYWVFAVMCRRLYQRCRTTMCATLSAMIYATLCAILCATLYTTLPVTLYATISGMPATALSTEHAT